MVFPPPSPPIAHVWVYCTDASTWRGKLSSSIHPSKEEECRGAANSGRLGVTIPARFSFSSLSRVLHSSPSFLFSRCYTAKKGSLEGNPRKNFVSSTFFAKSTQGRNSPKKARRDGERGGGEARRKLCVWKGSQSPLLPLGLSSPVSS